MKLKKYTQKVAKCCEEVINSGNFKNIQFTSASVVIPLDFIQPIADKYKLNSKSIFRILNGMTYERSLEIKN